ncbi:NUDIX domain-containing protein (plasmid) [Kovacikia minuta CCNUW1]|uniref:NUDIX domain-containing protein n=1 Tax=Kovacikia minuta TaxID=2931930 RepID=UPI001CCAAB6B|nr:NUDIX domain-containing protein [Kovacikia minuta]UBF29946.1 NUDIX domain-containing protein [Kovacikia minuta CCNUW1]
MSKASHPYYPCLIESLKNPEEAILYIESISEEGSDLSLEDRRSLLAKAIGDVVQAYGGNSNAFRDTKEIELIEKQSLEVLDFKDTQQVGEQVIFETPGQWLQVVKTPRGFYYARRKNKDSVAIFLVRKGRNGWEVLVRFQPLPLHNADLDSVQTLYPCPITGGLDSPTETPIQCAVREVYEETGYSVEVDYLGLYVVGTQTDELVYLFWQDVTGLEPDVPQQDGTYFESISRNEWKPLVDLEGFPYSACQIGYYKLLEILN